MPGKADAKYRIIGEAIPLGIGQESIFSTAMKASLGTWTVPN